MFGRKKESAHRVCAVIVAAGSSRRMGGENKLMLPLGGMPVLARTLCVFEDCPMVQSIVLVCREQDIAEYSGLIEEYRIRKATAVVRGGDSRTASVLAGLQACPEGTELAAVHDGARPLVTQDVICSAVRAAAENGAAAPVVPIKDSVKRVANGVIVADVPRESIAAVQTPQVFRLSVLQAALLQAGQRGISYTDDCAAVEAQGISVCATQGSNENIKITTREDLRIGEALLAEREE